MDLTASIRPGESASQCILLGNSDVIVNGKFAQFGGRMMTSVSDMMLAKFADNFSHKAADLSAQADQAAPQAPSGGGVAQNTGPVKPHTELNAFSVLWGLIRNFFSGLLGTRK
jgi:hypothetical protein